LSPRLSAAIGLEQLRQRRASGVDFVCGAAGDIEHIGEASAAARGDGRRLGAVKFVKGFALR
jgi:hypothetical protein